MPGQKTKHILLVKAFLTAMLLSLCLSLSACNERVSYEELSGIAKDIGSEAEGIVNEAQQGGAVEGEVILKGMLDGVSGQVASFYTAAHRYVVLAIILSWLIMLTMIILEHSSESKLKIAVVGFGITLPLAIVTLDIGCGLYLGWNAEGGMPAAEDNLFLVTARGIVSYTPVIVIMAVFILAIGFVYLLLGKRGKMAWRSFGFSVLIDIALMLLVVGSRIAIS